MRARIRNALIQYTVRVEFSFSCADLEEADSVGSKPKIN